MSLIFIKWFYAVLILALGVILGQISVGGIFIEDLKLLIL